MTSHDSHTYTYLVAGLKSAYVTTKKPYYDNINLDVSFSDFHGNVADEGLKVPHELDRVSLSPWTVQFPHAMQILRHALNLEENKQLDSKRYMSLTKKIVCIHCCYRVHVQCMLH